MEPVHALGFNLIKYVSVNIGHNYCNSSISCSKCNHNHTYNLNYRTDKLPCDNYHEQELDEIELRIINDNKYDINKRWPKDYSREWLKIWHELTDEIIVQPNNDQIIVQPNNDQIIVQRNNNYRNEITKNKKYNKHFFKKSKKW
jgi:hypothetical protein